MDMGCIRYLMAQRLKLFLSGLSEGLLLCALEHLVSAAMMPCLHYREQVHSTRLYKRSQLLLEMQFVYNCVMNHGKICLRHRGVLGGEKLVKRNRDLIMYFVNESCWG